jgi:hypothetical protein
MKVTGKQCQKARALLKWNVRDLVSRMEGVQPRRIDSFEKGVVQLYGWENDKMKLVFEKSGIAFLEDFQVVLREKMPENMVGQNEGAHIVLDANHGMISDTIAQKTGGLSSEENPDDSVEPQKKNRRPQE